MDFIIHYFTLKNMFGNACPMDIIFYIMQMMMFQSIQIFCSRNHTFVIRENNIGDQVVHYYGKELDGAAVVRQLHFCKFHSFYNWENAVSIILPCRQKVIWYRRFEYAELDYIFLNNKYIEDFSYFNGHEMVIYTLPENIISIFYGHYKIYVLSENRKTIYGLVVNNLYYYSKFEFVSQYNSIILYRYFYDEEIKKIITGDTDTYILTITGYLYKWKDHKPSQQQKININSLVDFSIGIKIPSLALKSDGTVYALDHLNNLTILEINEEVKEIYCDRYHADILTKCGKVYGFKLDDNDKFVLYLNESIKIRCSNLYHGSCHSFLKDTDGKFYAMGDNKYGQLGIEKSGHVSEPIEVDLYDSSNMHTNSRTFL